MSLISCGGQKAVVKSGKSQVDKPKKSFMGSLLSSATSLSEVKAISSPTASLPGANQISVSSGADRKSIELEEIEEPRNLQITTFVSISKVLS